MLKTIISTSLLVFFSMPSHAESYSTLLSGSWNCIHVTEHKSKNKPITVYTNKFTISYSSKSHLAVQNGTIHTQYTNKDPNYSVLAYTTKSNILFNQHGLTSQPYWKNAKLLKNGLNDWTEESVQLFKNLKPITKIEVTKINDQEVILTTAKGEKMNCQRAH